jgi:YD repeat-containing protein
VNHDDQNYPSTKVGPRGNLTSEAECAAFSSGACVSWLTTTHTYDLAGQLTSTTDPQGNTISYSYTDQYTYGAQSAQTDGYVTTVTYPQTGSISRADAYTYSFYTGQATSHMDWNNQTTSFSYLDPSSGAPDPLNRLRQITLPLTVDGSTGQTAAGWTLLTYSDVPNAWSVMTQKLQSASGVAAETTANYDGLGRLSSTVISDPEGNDEVVRTYDGDSRLYTVTTPFRSATDLTYGVTTYTYDALNRLLNEQEPSGTGGSISTSYSGTTVATTDENGNQWQRTSDGLGRLTGVLEPNGVTSAPSMQTTYGYDPLNDLISVNQAGNGSSPAIQRSFSYDGLRRLKKAFNPESGATTYSYRTSSSQLCSGDPASVCSKTDARGITTNYSYDALNRLTEKGYSDGVTAWACYLYDSAVNGNGRLGREWTQKASAGGCSSSPSPSNGYLSARTISTYDATGRLLSEQEYTPANPTSGYPMNFTYDLAGNLTSSSAGVVPAGMTPSSSSPSAPCGNSPAFSSGVFAFVNCYDSVGRLIGVTTNAASGAPTLFSAQGYWPFGGLNNATYGSSPNNSNAAVTLQRTYDNRLRITSETDIGNSPSSTNGSATVTIVGGEQSQ